MFYSSLPVIPEELVASAPDIDWYDTRHARGFDRMLYQDQGIRRMWFGKKGFKRLVIYPKDIEIIFGKSARAAREYLTIMRDALGKSRNVPVTFYDFCKYAEMEPEIVIDFMEESW